MYRQEALKAYRMRMNEARAGRLEYPRIRTFSNAPHSTNDVQADLEEADKWCESFSTEFLTTLQVHL